MTDRENFLSIARRTGYERMPVYFNMCPSLSEKFSEYVKKKPIEFEPIAEHIPGVALKHKDAGYFL